LDLRSAMPLFDIFIGPDSGLLHIAASFGVRSIGIYGPTLASDFAPSAPCVAPVEIDLECRKKCVTPCPNNIECLRAIKFSDILKHM
ncbi:MAG TPA: glycosyltransferase family 9 protein, partial [Candidatus Wallbacteria bacterium]|nr:glycosyltransferase family 9 protein [Candidatus Wallbacteria bacterium]